MAAVRAHFAVPASGAFVADPGSSPGWRAHPLAAAAGDADFLGRRCDDAGGGV